MPLVHVVKVIPCPARFSSHVDRLRIERRPGVWHGGGLESDGVGGRGVGCDGYGGGWPEVCGRMEKRGRSRAAIYR